MFYKFEEEEITPEKGVPYSTVLVDCFNNFYCHFPMGNIPYTHEELVAELGNYRARSKIHGREGSSFKTTKYPKLLGLGEEEGVDVTRNEFYEELYTTVEECSLTMEDVSKTINPLSENRSSMTDDDYEKIFKTLAPIFKAMRLKGYSHQDLWG